VRLAPARLKRLRVGALTIILRPSLSDTL